MIVAVLVIGFLCMLALYGIAGALRAIVQQLQYLNHGVTSLVNATREKA